MRPAGGIGGSIARSIEDRISYSRVISRDNDLYGKRSRHWSTADPIQFLVVLLAVCLALTICGLACDPPPPSPDDPPFDTAGVIAKVTSLRGLYLVTWIPLLFYSVIGAAVTAVIAHQSARLLVNVVMAASWTVIVLCLMACEIVDIASLQICRACARIVTAGRRNIRHGPLGISWIVILVLAIPPAGGTDVSALSYHVSLIQQHMHRLGGLLYSAANGWAHSIPLQNAITHIKCQMQQHFQHCIVLLLGGASVRTALSNISNASSKKRTGKREVSNGKAIPEYRSKQGAQRMV